MEDESLTLAAFARHWARDAICACAAVLAAVGVAHAAIPKQTEPQKVPVRVAAATVQPPAPAPSAPPVETVSFVEPVPGYEVVSPFGLRRLPWEAHGRLHAGVDISAPRGEPVRAVADGVVVRAGTDGGYGRLIDVRHENGLVSRYAHLSAIAATVFPGAAVAAGQPIGVVGSTGTSTGTHLHFEVRDARDRPLNPRYFIGRTYASAEAIPVRAAARYSRHVRLAQVSYIPPAKRELMAARDAVPAEPAASALASGVEATDSGRVRARIAVVPNRPLSLPRPAEGPVGEDGAQKADGQGGRREPAGVRNGQQIGHDGGQNDAADDPAGQAPAAGDQVGRRGAA